MDEKRFEALEKNQLDEMRENASFRGEIRAFLKAQEDDRRGLFSEIKGARAELQAHKDAEEPHPNAVLAESRRFRGGLIAVLTAVGGFAGILGGMIHKLMESLGRHAP